MSGQNIEFRSQESGVRISSRSERGHLLSTDFCLLTTFTAEAS